MGASWSGVVLYKLNDRNAKRNLTSFVAGAGLILTLSVLHFYPVGHEVAVVGLSLLGWYVLATLCLRFVKKTLYLRMDSHKKSMTIDRLGLPPKEIALDKITSISTLGSDPDIHGVVIGLIPARSYVLIKDIFDSPDDFNEVWQQLSQSAKAGVISVSRLQFPWVTVVLILLLVSIHIATRYLLSSVDELFQNFGNLSFDLNESMSRYISYALLHVDTTHLVFNIASLAIIGESMEKLIGRYKIINIFSIAVIIGGMLSSYFSHYDLSVGASGGLFGLIGSYVAAFFILHRTIPANLYMPIKPVLVVLGLDFLYALFFSEGVDVVCHAGGFLAGIACGWLSMASADGCHLRVNLFEKVAAWVFVFLYGFCAVQIMRFAITPSIAP